MRSLSPSDLLSVWERGYPQRLPMRGVLLLAAALPDTAPDELLSLPLGRRDAELLAFREENFGTAFEGVTRCPSCEEPIELQFTSDDVRAAVATPVDAALSIVEGDRALDIRLPDSADLIALEEMAGDEATLLARCIGANADSLSDDTARAVAERIEAADPMAAVRLTIGCAACGAPFTRPFDIVAFLWAELDAWAKRVAREVHLLANAYGWSENDILMMSPWRRQLYAELLQ